MTRPHPRGAFARAVLVALCLFLIAALAVAPHVHAMGRDPLWARIPGDSYRSAFSAFAMPPTRPDDGFANAGRSAEGGPMRDRAGVVALVRARAVALGVPAGLALAIAHFESGLRMSMRGAAGECGAMQVLPQTARAVGVRGNLYGPAGIEAGVRYLKLAVALHRGAGWCAVASAYNRGVWRSSRCTRYGRSIAAMAARQ
jgi:soluble lytic murein transglycosylase-like protein